MPELPEVETVVQSLAKVLTGKVFEGAQSLGKLRVPFDAALAGTMLRNRAVTGVRRRAKYLLIDVEGGSALLCHLGMTGFFHLDEQGDAAHSHDRAAFPLKGGQVLRFADARRFGFVKPVRLGGPDVFPDELADLGVEPLQRFNPGMMIRLASGRKVAVKSFIMDQKIVVGVGNIYASEALYAAGIDPARPAGALDEAEWKRLVREVKKTLRRAIRAGGSTIINYRTVDGSEGKFQRRLLVYGRAGEGCGKCGQPIRSSRIGGRSTFYCPACQK